MKIKNEDFSLYLSNHQQKELRLDFLETEEQASQVHEKTMCIKLMNSYLKVFKKSDLYVAIGNVYNILLTRFRHFNTEEVKITTYEK